MQEEFEWARNAINSSFSFSAKEMFFLVYFLIMTTLVTPVRHWVFHAENANFIAFFRLQITCNRIMFHGKPTKVLCVAIRSTSGWDVSISCWLLEIHAARKRIASAIHYTIYYNSVNSNQSQSQSQSVSQSVTGKNWKKDCSFWTSTHRLRFTSIILRRITSWVTMPARYNSALDTHLHIDKRLKEIYLSFLAFLTDCIRLTVTKESKRKC